MTRGCDQLLLSVIIPTYNRKEMLMRMMESLAQQTLAPDCYEVIVVDDGSTDRTEDISSQRFPFDFKYVKQENRGATLARNNGAGHSCSDILVFLDDDIAVYPRTLEILTEECASRSRAIILGTLVVPNQSAVSFFGRIYANSIAGQPQVDDSGFVPYTYCKTGLLAVRRNDFYEIGMFHDPTGGWPNWDDVEFGYRAQAKGFRIRQSALAVGEHWDHALNDLTTFCRRVQHASKAAARLSQRYPDILPNLPMFDDKTPIALRHDSPGLVARKIVRRIASSGTMSGGLQGIVKTLERQYPAPGLLAPLYRWIIGAYIFRGYREGLRENGIR